MSHSSPAQGRFPWGRLARQSNRDDQSRSKRFPSSRWSGASDCRCPDHSNRLLPLTNQHSNPTAHHCQRKRNARSRRTGGALNSPTEAIVFMVDRESTRQSYLLQLVFFSLTESHPTHPVVIEIHRAILLIDRTISAVLRENASHYGA